MAVDNDNIIGLIKTSVQRALCEVIGDFTGSGFKVHEQVDATEELNLVGIVFDGRRRTLRLTHRRLWRLHTGLLHFCGWHKAAGLMVRVLLGHVVNAFQLLRWGLSVLDQSYKFVVNHLTDWVELPGGVREELRRCAWLLLCECDLSRPTTVPTLLETATA